MEHIPNIRVAVAILGETTKCYLAKEIFLIYRVYLVTDYRLGQNDFAEQAVYLMNNASLHTNELNSLKFAFGDAE